MRISNGVRIVLHLLLCMFLFGGMSTAKAEEPTPQWLSNEVYCLARVIYAESRNLPELAQYDVAYSVMNRVELNRKDFGGGTVCAVAFHVVRRPDGVFVRQYSGVTGALNDAWRPADWDAWFDSLQRAWRVYTGREVPSDEMRHALYYMNPKHSTNNSKGWFGRKLRPIKWSSLHLFFAER